MKIVAVGDIMPGGILNIKKMNLYLTSSDAYFNREIFELGHLRLQ